MTQAIAEPALARSSLFRAEPKAAAFKPGFRYKAAEEMFHLSRQSCRPPIDFVRSWQHSGARASYALSPEILDAPSHEGVRRQKASKTVLPISSTGGNMALSHLHRGDVVFTVDAKGTATHIVISTAQRIGSPFHKGHANSIHAAIATGNQFEVIESVGSGVRAKQLGQGNYRVFAYRGVNQREIRDFAAIVAEGHLVQREFTDNYGAYNNLKAAKSPFRLLSGGSNHASGATRQFGEGAHAHTSFFCSNFVWRCFTGAAEMVSPPQATLPIPGSYSQLSPRDLEALLIKSADWHARGGGHAMSHP